jgi:hypothetical protein
MVGGADKVASLSSISVLAFKQYRTLAPDFVVRHAAWRKGASENLSSAGCNPEFRHELITD